MTRKDSTYLVIGEQHLEVRNNAAGYAGGDNRAVNRTGAPILEAKNKGLVGRYRGRPRHENAAIGVEDIDRCADRPR